MTIQLFIKVQNSHTSTNGKIRDLCDGEYFKNHQLFGAVKNALIIHGYYDESQVTNPLGSRTKVHKLGNNFLFYFPPYTHFILSSLAKHHKYSFPV